MEEFSSNCARKSKLHMIDTFNLAIFREIIIKNSKNLIFEGKYEHASISKTTQQQFIDQQDKNDMKFYFNDYKTFYFQNENPKSRVEDFNKNFNTDDCNHCQIKFKNNPKR